MNGNPAFFMRALDNHTRHTSLRAVFLDKFAHAQIFKQQVPVIFGIRIPAAIPSPVDLQAHTNWINFLSH